MQDSKLRTNSLYTQDGGTLDSLSLKSFVTRGRQYLCYISAQGLRNQTAWVQTPIPLHTACVALSKLPTLFVPQFHNLKGHDNVTSLIWLL